LKGDNKTVATTFKARVFHGLLEPLEPVNLPSEGKMINVTIEDEAELNSSQGIEQRPSRWADWSKQIKKEKALRGLGKEVMASVKEFRDNFAFRNDE
jgi:hypothetical protein